MPEQHPYGQQFLEHLAATQQAYAERRLDDYLAGFAEHYYSVQLHTDWFEDKSLLAHKIALDIERYEVLRMDFAVKRSWFIGERGYAHLSYETELKQRRSGTVMFDKRENLLLGEHLGGGRWMIDSKIVLAVGNSRLDNKGDG